MTIAPEPCAACGQNIPKGEPPKAAGRVAFMPEARKTIESTLEQHKGELTKLSHYLHENPELAWKETKAHAAVTDFLSKQGFKIENYKEYPTAFRVSYTRGSGGRTFGLNSEYDALPDIGHACGHNLIAITGVGALLALKAAMDEHKVDGTVVLIGTPAEEGDAGKVRLLEAGAYEGMGACMMLHPGRGEESAMNGAVVRSYAYQPIKVSYEGKPSHAGLAPWEGVNALDAATTAYAAIGVMRQQLKPESRVQGVITYGGGTAPNVIPPRSELNFLVRAPTSAELAVVRAKVLQCFEGAAITSGCKVKIEEGTVVKELRNDKSLADEFAHVMNEMYQAPILVALEQSMGASTDFGNVTQTMPGCHPMYGIPAPVGAQNHTPGFTAAAKTEEAHDRSFKCTAGMAAVGLRFLADADFAKDVKASWEKQMADLKVSNRKFAEENGLDVNDDE